MRYLLDTCVLSDFINGDLGTLQKLKSISPASICLSTVTVSEIYYGFSQYPDKAAQLKSVLESFLKGVSIVPFEWGDAEVSARVKASLTKAGKNIGSYDTLIAGTALKRGLILVTSNTPIFEEIPGLELENWRQVSGFQL
ncbi:MAG: type II toxin-antitoxin system VapC family toxin [Alphaproteobacteria bacterium]|jgi:tRNA(fMet)-specific endonuclease VapC|nr:type II toxin-antitoxin system VapC family toxin [Alphaproteobacteria bacterium]